MTSGIARSAGATLLALVACARAAPTDAPRPAAVELRVAATSPPPADFDAGIAAATSAASRDARRVPCASCAPVERLPTARRVTRAVVDVDGAFFFEGRGKRYQLLRLAQGSGDAATTELAEWPRYGELRSDATSLYWVDDDGVHAIAKSGGAVRTLAVEAMGPMGSRPWMPPTIALDDTHVYFAHDRGGQVGVVRRVPKQGGAVDTLASGRTFPWVVTVDTATLYWVEPLGISKPGERPPSVHVLRAMPKRGGASSIVPLANAAAIRTLVAIVADADSIYWIGNTLGYNRGELRRVAKAGGKHDTLATDIHTFYGDAMAIDATHVYWLDFPNGAYDPMNVRAVAKSGGATITLATPPSSNKIFVDGERVWWADNGMTSLELPW